MQSHSDIYRYIQKSGIYSNLWQRSSINIPCKDPYAKPATSDLVLSTTIVTAWPTIEQDVRPVLEKEKVSKVESHAGKQQATRKNPHVTNAGSKPNTQVNCWCCMLMAISTIPNFAI
jgi:hypothetical protein